MKSGCLLRLVAVLVLGFLALAPWLAVRVTTGPWAYPALVLLRLPWPDLVLKRTIERARDERVRIKALDLFLRTDGVPGKAADQQKAFEIAADADAPLAAARAASWYLRDNDLRLRIVNGCGSVHPDICVETINRLPSGESWEASVREMLSQVIPQPAVRAIATRAQSEALRVMATSRLADPDQLFQIAQDDKRQGVRHAALARVTGDDRIVRLLRSRAAEPEGTLADKKADNICLATENLLDHGRLAELATTDADSGVRALAVSCTKNQAVLSAVLANDPSMAVRTVAVNHSDDELLLTKLGHDGASPLQDQACGRLSFLLRGRTQPALEDVALRGTDPLIRRLAVGWLDGEKTLARIAAADRSPEVKRQARDRLAFLRSAARHSSPPPATWAYPGPLPGYLQHDRAENHRVPGW